MALQCLKTKTGSHLTTLIYCLGNGYEVMQIQTGRVIHQNICVKDTALCMLRVLMCVSVFFHKKLRINFFNFQWENLVEVSEYWSLLGLKCKSQICLSLCISDASGVPSLRANSFIWGFKIARSYPQTEILFERVWIICSHDMYLVLDKSLWLFLQAPFVLVGRLSLSEVKVEGVAGCTFYEACCVSG